MANELATALAALSGTGKRARIHNAQMVIKLPKAVKDLISEYADTRGESEATVARQAFAEFFERRGYGDK